MWLCINKTRLTKTGKRPDLLHGWGLWPLSQGTHMSLVFRLLLSTPAASSPSPKGISSCTCIKWTHRILFIGFFHSFLLTFAFWWLLYVCCYITSAVARAHMEGISALAEGGISQHSCGLNPQIINAVPPSPFIPSLSSSTSTHPHPSCNHHTSVHHHEFSLFLSLFFKILLNLSISQSPPPIRAACLMQCCS